jgi:hypothetical protein
MCTSVPMPRGGKTNRVNGTKLMAVVDGAGFPLALSVGSASPHEVALVEDTLEIGSICISSSRHSWHGVWQLRIWLQIYKGCWKFHFPLVS